MLVVRRGEVVDSDRERENIYILRWVWGRRTVVQREVDSLDALFMQLELCGGCGPTIPH